jgi:hypothetical protein
MVDQRVLSHRLLYSSQPCQYLLIITGVKIFSFAEAIIIQDKRITATFIIGVIPKFKMFIS